MKISQKELFDFLTQRWSVWVDVAIIWGLDEMAFWPMAL